MPSCIMRQLAVQEQRALVYNRIEYFWDELLEDFHLQDDIRDVNEYLLGRPSAYLWNSPWFEFDAPEWVHGHLGPDSTWWCPWRESGGEFRTPVLSS